jgi:hypothetical protein
VTTSELTSHLRGLLDALEGAIKRRDLSRARGLSQEVVEWIATAERDLAVQQRRLLELVAELDAQESVTPGAQPGQPSGRWAEPPVHSAGPLPASTERLHDDELQAIERTLGRDDPAADRKR